VLEVKKEGREGGRRRRGGTSDGAEGGMRVVGKETQERKRGVGWRGG